MAVKPDDAKHPVTTDKQGSDVSNNVSVALSELRDCGASASVICDWAQSGRIQWFGDGKYLPGEVVETARECGYVLDHATTRHADAVSHYVAGDRCAYAEFVPQDDPAAPTDN